MAVLISGCDVLGDDDETVSVASSVIVANGGNFSDQNGFITGYNIESGDSQHYSSVGGFLQGLYLDRGNIYALVNTFSEGRIDVIQRESMSVVSQITSLPAPRDAVRVGETLFVTNFIWGSPGQVIPVNLPTGETGAAIEVGEVPEGIIEIGGKVFVANNGSGGSETTLSVIDPLARQVTHTLDVGCDGPRDLYEGKKGVLIVVCAGKTLYSPDFTEIIEQTNGKIVFVNADTFNILGSIDLPGQAASTNGTETAFYSSETRELFVTLAATNTIITIDTASRTIQNRLELSAGDGHTGLSGIAYDAHRDRLFAGRFPVSAGGPFPDFTSAGSVLIMSRDGSVESSFLAGVAISSIVLQ